jgi:hypothetical protein
LSLGFLIFWRNDLIARIKEVVASDVCQAEVMRIGSLVSEVFVRVPAPEIKQVLSFKDQRKSLLVARSIQVEGDLFGRFRDNDRTTDSLKLGHFVWRFERSVTPEGWVGTIRSGPTQFKVVRVAISSISEGQDYLWRLFLKIRFETAHHNARAFGGFVRRYLGLEQTISESGIDDSGGESTGCGECEDDTQNKFSYRKALSGLVAVAIGMIGITVGYLRAERLGVARALCLVSLSCLVYGIGLIVAFVAFGIW